MHETTQSKELDRSVSDYLAVSRGRQNFASEVDYHQAEEQSWAVLMDALAGMGQEHSGPMPDEMAVGRWDR